MVINNLQKIKSEEKESADQKFTNFDAELAIIGCLLWDNRSYEKIADFLTEDHFENINNKKIFKTIKLLLDKNLLVTPITLQNYLENDIEDPIDVDVEE